MIALEGGVEGSQKRFLGKSVEVIRVEVPTLGILWSVRTRGHDGALIMGGQLLVAGINVRVISMRFTHRAF